ncbi:hypothetical protein PPL_00942 [Heterostelium album PN500]|uniref:Uncharacterized protein n=1 Tax=Heterostelium pallidum (strain ATCC 26659 / Pp 5 / PN500) TaxID=670386 RepID=D3AXN5_HETP5|nr:hypothetical protein PPL_00942 [Heterostelium album PN500]EFA85712.1 hypothetical protein PPL_00942 [Heterostelium album PN500]|eukprot:XP_020437818.1 hypothetical protein PPL_00942 [Heterostelium album PN500]
MDDILPFLSGQPFRLQSITNEEFYRRVQSRCRAYGVLVPSESYMYKHFLRKEYIHHTKYDVVCKDCEELKKLEALQARRVDPYPANSTKGLKIAKLKLHQFIAHKQREIYGQQKQAVINDLTGESAVILMDFSQIQHQQSLRQALIISVYCVQENAVYFTYHTYLAPTTTTKNDCAFVIGCLLKFLTNEPVFKTIKKLNIWTDGCTKHFKMTTNIYHGCNSCDAAASQIKQKINVLQRDTGIPLYTVQQVRDVINTMANHRAQIAHITTKPSAPPTMTNITKNHRYIFNVENNTISAYQHSGEVGNPVVYNANIEVIANVVNADPYLTDDLEYLLEDFARLDQNNNVQ